jgi:hypothetical protein
VTVIKEPPTFNEIMNMATASAVRGGTAGAVAIGANVACLMWMRTTVSLALIALLLLYSAGTDGQDFVVHQSVRWVLRFQSSPAFVVVVVEPIALHPMT